MDLAKIADNLIAESVANEAMAKVQQHRATTKQTKLLALMEDASLDISLLLFKCTGAPDLSKNERQVLTLEGKTGKHQLWMTHIMEVTP